MLAQSSFLRVAKNYCYLIYSLIEGSYSADEDCTGLDCSDFSYRIVLTLWMAYALAFLSTLSLDLASLMQMSIRTS